MLISIVCPISISSMLRLEVICSPNNRWEARNSLQPFSVINLSRLLFSLSVASSAITKSFEIASWLMEVDGLTGFLGQDFFRISGLDRRFGLWILGVFVICFFIYWNFNGDLGLLRVTANTKWVVTSLGIYKISWVYPFGIIVVPIVWSRAIAVLWIIDSSCRLIILIFFF